jgi:hypothetical protein
MGTGEPADLGRQSVWPSSDAPGKGFGSVGTTSRASGSPMPAHCSRIARSRRIGTSPRASEVKASAAFYFCRGGRWASPSIQCFGQVSIGSFSEMSVGDVGFEFDRGSPGNDGVPARLLARSP